MTVLMVDEPGCVISRRGEQIIVSRKAASPMCLPITQIDRIIVRGGGIQVTTPVLSLLAERGIDVAYLRRSGRLMGRFSAPARRDAAIRIHQLAFIASRERRLGFARDIVRGKLLNQATLLERRGAKRAARAIRDMAAASGAAADLDALRGFEGRGGHWYFGAWRDLLPSEVQFNGRSYHPPRDAVNAALSLVYTFLLHDGLIACEGAGLDPDVGVLHEPGPAKPALALDLIEEFRPLVADPIVLEAAKRGQISVDKRQREIVLTARSRTALLEAYERRMTTKRRAWDGVQTSHRRCMVRQAEQAAGVVLGKHARYRPLSGR